LFRFITLLGAVVGCAGISPVNRPATDGHIALQNPSVRVVIAPELGRITSIEFGGSENLLRYRPATGPATNAWHDFGGEYIWPVSQVHWREAFGRIWPPAAVFDARPWTARQWTTADGTRVCRLEQTLGEALEVRASRQIELPARGAMLRIVQRLERVGPSFTPVTLWNISQVPQPDQIILPANNSGLITLGGTPGGNARRVGNGWLIDFAKSDETAHKLGMAATPAWIAARKGNVLIVQRASESRPGGLPPDGGCSVELWWNRPAGYAELELLSAELPLAVGGHVEDNVTMEFCRVPGAIPDAALVQQIERINHEAESQH
jgi:hypothetical protein